MAIRSIVFVVCLLLPASFMLAQGFEVPKDYKLQEARDYANYEPDIVKCIDYLESTPLDAYSDNRKEASAFLLKWIRGSPNVDISLKCYLADLIKKNKDFLIIFMGGWTKYSLQNDYSADKIKGHLAGLRSILRVYQNGKGVKKDEKVEELIALDKEDGKLEEWLKIVLRKE